jgi:hypothetical protein
MRTFALMTMCIGISLTVGSIGAQSGGGHSAAGVTFETVDRTHKGDRFPSSQRKVPNARTSDLQLPEGCDGLVSPLAHRQLARVAAQCES